MEPKSSSDVPTKTAELPCIDNAILPSQDLFSNFSQDTVSSYDSKQLDIERQLKDFSWVQCDNVDCQKWRKIRTEVTNRLDDKDQWFCYMNSDLQYNSCDASEEDYTTYDKLAKKCGLKFIMSKLAEGSLVWAKMVGYCRWPGIVTKDPVSGYFFEVDYHGDPTVYHIEYLGKHHSHAWVAANRITLYGHKEDTASQYIKKKMTGRGKRKLLSMTNKNKPERKRYKRMDVNDAIIEADLMLDLTEDERLSRCQFQSVVKEQHSVIDNVKIELVSKHCVKTSQEHALHHGNLQKNICQERTYHNKNPYSTVVKRQKTLQNDTQKVPTKHKTKSVRSSNNICHSCGQDDEVFQPFHETTEMDHIIKQEPTDSGVGTSGDLPTSSSSESGRQQKLQSASLNFNSSMVNKSKEEKFKIDIQMYTRNEKAFDHDLRRFMDRNNMILKRTPMWHNVPVGLFQLFLAVHERGGFLEVCCKRLWSSVYKELTDTHHASSGQTAKNFYERNLYPYELYLSGKSFHHAVEKFGKKVKEKTICNSETNTNSHLQAKSTECDSEESEDLEAMLDELEDYSNLCQIEDDVKIDTLQRGLGIDVKFHDDSTPEGNFSPGIKVADTASEFGKAKSPGGSAHCVPYAMFSSTSGSSRDVQILHEMKALEKNLAALDGDEEFSL